MCYTELQVTSNFSFLRGASHPEELMAQAAALGYTALAITDRNTLAGIVRAHVAAKKEGIRLIVGCCLALQDGPDVLVYPTCRAGYASLCELLSTGNLRAEKGDCHLYLADVCHYLQQVQLIVVPPATLNAQWQFDDAFLQALHTLQQAFPQQVHLAATRRYQGADARWLYQLAQLSAQYQLPMVATNDVHYHLPERRQLQDVITCIREKCTIYNAGYRLYPNAERYLKSADEMQRLFMQYPQAIEQTQHIANSCCFSLDELQYEYPEEITTEGRTPQQELVKLTWEGAHAFYGQHVPDKVCRNIEYELAFIEQMNYAPYFLTVHDIVRFARSRGILCQGRGSAANSTVCFCLGITSVNPAKFDLLFERFISAARNEPPDIDVDFEHERREEVIQYIYEKYGRDRAAIVATVTQLHQKGALRDVAKAMGLSQDTINSIAGTIHRMSDDWFSEAALAELGLDLNDAHLRKVLQLTQQYVGFPRQLGQHTGGFVITRHKLHHLCPVLNARMENRTCIEWNKDDIEALRFLKIDILALGMLTCIRKAFHLMEQHHGVRHTLATVPQDDPAVYDMICRADTVGVFQIESRAQQQMLPRLKPRCFYDLVIEVAIVRPGPIQGDMVHPYLRRRSGKEAVSFPSEELRAILGRTLGVPLFQEQAMKVAMVAAGFTPAEADELRRSMATFKAKGKVSRLEEKLIAGMTSRGYELEYAQRVFRQLEGFGSYGFPESHAASFAQLVYVSCWIKHYYPDVFACALLNSLPMGFYQPAQIVIDAQKHGVEVRPVDVNASDWDHRLEERTGRYCALRLGFRQIKGMHAHDAAMLLRYRQAHGRFASLYQVANAGLSDAALERLADADAFQSLGLSRRQAMWQVSVKDKPVALFAGQPAAADDKAEQGIQLPLMQLSEHVLHDYAATALSLKAHPVQFLREKLSLLRVIPGSQLAGMKNGDAVKVAGLVLVRQRPETARGVWFITLEDETGFINLVVFHQVGERYKREIIQARLLMVEGKLQVEGEVIHVIVSRCYNLSAMLGQLLPAGQSLPALPALSRSDEMHSLAPHQQADRAARAVVPDARNFR
jgi:error-prone DNA polymerase